MSKSTAASPPRPESLIPEGKRGIEVSFPHDGERYGAWLEITVDEPLDFLIERTRELLAQWATRAYLKATGVDHPMYPARGPSASDEDPEGFTRAMVAYWVRWDEARAYVDAHARYREQL